MSEGRWCVATPASNGTAACLPYGRLPDVAEAQLMITPVELAAAGRRQSAATCVVVLGRRRAFAEVAASAFGWAPSFGLLLIPQTGSVRLVLSSLRRSQGLREARSAAAPRPRGLLLTHRQLSSLTAPCRPRRSRCVVWPLTTTCRWLLAPGRAAPGQLRPLADVRQWDATPLSFCERQRLFAATAHARMVSRAPSCLTRFAVASFVLSVALPLCTYR